MTLTLYEIDWRLKSIVDRKNLTMSFEAKIHGHDLKVPKQIEDKEEMTLNERQMKAIEKAQEEYSRKHKESDG